MSKVTISNLKDTVLSTDKFPSLVLPRNKETELRKADRTVGVYFSIFRQARPGFPEEVRPCLTKYWKIYNGEPQPYGQPF